jgi:microcystin-dependent protein
MGQPFVGEIRMFGGNFAPQGWFPCDGRLLPIAQYEVLFALLGTTYGGDGQSTFGVPDLRGRIPVHVGSGFVQGQMAGSETVTLTTPQIPSHTHTAGAKTQATTGAAPGGLYGGGGLSAYRSSPGATMNAAMVQNNAGGQPHDNMMPFGAVSFIIAWAGIFPSRN